MTEPVMDVKAILDRIPHRYPFLLVDRVLELVPGESVTALKNVTINEPYFQGHFPGEPVMPGVLILEALAQAGLILGFASAQDAQEGTLVFFAGIDNARFKRQVVPGDQLTLKVWYSGGRKRLWKFHAEASVEGQLAASADVLAIPVAPNER